MKRVQALDDLRDAAAGETGFTRPLNGLEAGRVTLPSLFPVEDAKAQTRVDL